MELRIHGSLVPRNHMEPKRHRRSHILRRRGKQRQNNLRRNRRLLLQRPTSHLRTPRKRTTTSNRHRTPGSPTRIHHAHRRVASPRKRPQRHAPKTLPIQKPKRLTKIRQRQTRNPDAPVDSSRQTAAACAFPEANDRLLPTKFPT